MIPPRRIWPNAWGPQPRKAFNAQPRDRLKFARLQEPEAQPRALSQLGHDTGRDDVNCGPTCLAMAGYAWGIIPANASVRGAIMATSRWAQTGSNGSTGYGITMAAKAMGLDFERQSVVNAAAVRDLLADGAHVIVRGNSYDLPWADEYTVTSVQPPPDVDDPMSGHVVYVVGQDDRGEFIVHDPYLTDGKPRTLTDTELDTFGQKHDRFDRPFLLGVARAQFGVTVQQFGHTPKPGSWRDP